MPSLKTLRWPYDSAVIALLLLFPPLTLDTLCLDHSRHCIAGRHGHDLHGVDLSCFAVLSTLIVSRCTCALEPHQCQRIVDTALSAPNLRTFRLWGPTIHTMGQNFAAFTPFDLMHFGTSTTLEVLELPIGAFNDWTDTIDLPALRRLRCSAESASITSLVSCLHAPKLLKLELSTSAETLDDHVQCMDMLAISSLARTLRGLSLIFHTRTTRDSMRLPAFLGPLYSLTHLESLAISCPYLAVDATDADLRAAAQALGHLHKLSLRGVAFLPHAPASHARSAFLPPAALAHFARHCPRLRKLDLGMWLDALGPLPLAPAPDARPAPDRDDPGHPRRLLSAWLPARGPEGEELVRSAGAMRAFARALDGLFPHLDVPRMRRHASTLRGKGEAEWGLVLDHVQAFQLRRRATLE